MKPWRQIATSVLVMFVFSCLEIAQSMPGSTQLQRTAPSRTTSLAADPGAGGAKKPKAKEKRWSGSLVDANCMAKALSSTGAPGAGMPNVNPPGASHFGPSSGQAGQAGQGGTGPQSGGTGGPMPSTGPANNPSGPSMPNAGESQQEQQRDALERKVDQAATSCAATPSTQNFGLARSNGKVVRFDQGGNAQAAAAVKGVELKPGKKVKATVTVTMQGTSLGKVASVKVKGKHSSSQSSSGG
jgi:hypothetical protein